MKTELLIFIFFTVSVIFIGGMILFPNNSRQIASVGLLVIIAFIVIHNSNKNGRRFK